MRVESSTWHDVVTTAIADGYSSFITYTAVDDDGVQLWLRLRSAAGDDRVLSTASDIVDSIIDIIPQASWYEREIAEMFGTRFTGHDTTPLLLDAGSPTTPLRKDVYLAARNETVWPGGKEPGESGDRPPSRRRLLPPGVKA